MDVKLNFVNQSGDNNNSQIVIFGHEDAAPAGGSPVAWKVIHTHPGATHHFTYPRICEVEVGYGAGEHSRRHRAEAGQRFTFTEADGRHHLSESGAAASHTALEVVNGLPRGAIDASVYRDGRLFATKRGIAPKGSAVFSLAPTLRIGAAPHVHEGSIMNLAVLTSVDTQISLLGIASADIVMTGGGTGPNSAPFKFSLANVDMA